ncbi:MAG: VWA domain-containing protein [Blastocatellia bacterium]
MANFVTKRVRSGSSVGWVKSLLTLSLLGAMLVSLGAPVGAQVLPERAPVAAPAETIRVSTELVVIDAQVIDRQKGEMVRGLQRSDFLLREAGEAQSISHFSQDRLTLSVVLLLDLSGSVSPALSQIREGALEAIGRLKEADEVALLAFSSEAQVLQDFTRNRKLVADRIGHLERTAGIGRGTSLYHGLVAAARHVREAGQWTGRKVILVITDNIAWESNFSGLSEAEVSREILASGAMVCGLVVEGALSRTERIFLRNGDGRDLYRRAMRIDPFIELTGGEIARTTSAQIRPRLGGLIENLRNRYSLAFTPRLEGTVSGEFRPLAVELTPDARARLGREVQVRARRGYLARDAQAGNEP